jgi:hypothetical protein
LNVTNTLDLQSEKQKQDWQSTQNDMGRTTFIKSLDKMSDSLINYHLEIDLIVTNAIALQEQRHNL